MSATLYYVHDPMCSWCWAFHRVHEAVLAGLPDEVKITRLLGGLAPDTLEDMPEAMQGYVKNHWRTIMDKVPGTEFNFEFWEKCKPRRATYPACRAVIAARKQGAEYDRMMTLAIQRGYYLQARNPSDTDTLIALAGEISLDTDRFGIDLLSAENAETLKREIRYSRQLGATGFPFLLLEADGSQLHIPVNYTNAEVIIKAIRDNLH